MFGMSKPNPPLDPKTPKQPTPDPKPAPKPYTGTEGDDQGGDNPPASGGPGTDPKP